MIVIGTIIGLLSLLIAFCSMCVPYLSFVYGVGNVVACKRIVEKSVSKSIPVGLITGATVMYYIDASRESVRMYVSAQGRVYYVCCVEKCKRTHILQLMNDYAVYCALTSCGALAFNCLLCVPICVLSVMFKKEDDEKRFMERHYRYGEYAIFDVLFMSHCMSTES